jgi:hypothetical protein
MATSKIIWCPKVQDVNCSSKRIENIHSSIDNVFPASRVDSSNMQQRDSDGMQRALGTLCGVGVPDGYCPRPISAVVSKLVCLFGKVQ